MSRKTKALYSSKGFEKINDFRGDLIVYFLIDQEPTVASSWNRVDPVVQEQITGSYIHFGFHFCFQGGGSLSNMKSLFSFLKKYQKETKNNVWLIPKVTIDDSYLDEFKYVDSKYTLQDILENTIDLVNVINLSNLSNIYEMFIELKNEYSIN